MIHHRKHPAYVEGCYGCKLTSVAIFPPEGGTSDVARYRQSAREVAKDIEAYSGAKKNGLRPPTSTRKGVEKAERQAESEERALKKLGVKSLDEAKADWTPSVT